MQTKTVSIELCLNFDMLYFQVKYFSKNIL